MTKRHQSPDIAQQAAWDPIKAPQYTEAARRIFHTILRFWRVCPHKPCKRAHSCRGDVDACWQMWRPVVPDEVMLRIRVYIRARLDDLSPDESWRVATDEVARFKASRAEYEKRWPTQSTQ